MKRDNYMLMALKMREQFLKYDQRAMIDKFSLKADSEYIYLNYVLRPYRINRQTGAVQWSADGFATVHDAGHNEVMPIYDLLCDSAPGCKLSGRFNNIRNSARLGHTGMTSSGALYTDAAGMFDGKTELMSRACERLGGVCTPPGDVAYMMNTFDCLPVILRFWEGDEDFGASLSILWDENVLDFIRFETSFYVVGHLLSRIREEMENIKKQEEQNETP